MEYKYYNQFNLADNLARTLSEIISNGECADYVCGVLNVTIPEHEGLVFHSPLDNYNPWGGGMMALSGAQIQDVNEKYGWYDKGMIPAETYSFMAIIEKDSLELFNQMTFDDSKKIEDALKSLAVYVKKYFGSFNAQDLVQQFPYLKEFFESIDEWRAKTGSVTVDDEILEECKNLAMNNCLQGIKK